MLNLPALSGIFRYYELIAPVIPLADIIYLGEGHTPQVAANQNLENEVGVPFYFKNDGQNPSASFKDRGMAAALSYLNFLVKQPGAGKMLAICASTGDTSASAALYAAYLGDQVASAVILPHGKVTPQQLAQPLGSGAKVLEIPRRLRRLHESGGGPGRQLSGGPAQFQKLLAHPGPGVLCL